MNQENKEKPTTLDHILAYTPIPYFGERAAYKTAVDFEDNLRERGIQQSNFNRKLGIFLHTFRARVIAYCASIAALMYIAEEPILKLIESCLK